MLEERPSIPKELERAVLIEAGHRCAIPTCGNHPVEIVHIEPWAKVRRHEFHNLIALCPTCHARYDRGEIDRKSMKIYKRNLAMMSNRYNEMERRVLKYLGRLIRDGNYRDYLEVCVPLDSEFTYLNAIEDELLEYGTARVTGSGYRQVLDSDGVFRMKSIGETKRRAFIRLTEAGKQFVEKWFRGEELE